MSEPWEDFAPTPAVAVAEPESESGPWQEFSGGPWDDFTPTSFPITAETADQLRRDTEQRAAVGRGMEAGDTFLTAVAEDPKAFVKALPSIALGAATIPGQIAYQAAADVVSKVAGQPEYGGNLASGGSLETPVNKFLASVAQTNPRLATAGYIGRDLANMAPLAAVGMLPATVARLATAGFTADMLLHAPALFEEYGNELNKPEGDRDPAKIAELESGIAQTFAFAPLAGAHAIRGIPEQLRVAFDNARRWTPDAPPSPPRSGRGIEGEVSKRPMEPAEEGAPVPEWTAEEIPSPAGAGEGGRRPGEGSGEGQTTISARPAALPTEPKTAVAASPEAAAVNPKLSRPAQPTRELPAGTAPEGARAESPAPRGAPATPARPPGQPPDDPRSGADISPPASASPGLPPREAKAGPTPGAGSKGKAEGRRQKAETPMAAVAKVKDHLAETKADAPTPAAATRSAKEIKSELVERLESAQAKLGPEPELLYSDPRKVSGKREFYVFSPDKSLRLRVREGAGVVGWTIDAETLSGKTGTLEHKPMGSVGAGADIREATRAASSVMQKMLAGNPKPIKIQIPGDGNFTIEATHSAVGEVLRRAEKLTTGSGSPPKPYRPDSNPSLDQEYQAAKQIYGTPENAIARLTEQWQRAKELELSPEQIAGLERIINTFKRDSEAAKPVNQIWQDQYRKQLDDVARDIKAGATGLSVAAEVVRTAEMLELHPKEVQIALQNRGMTGRDSEYAVKSYAARLAAKNQAASPRGTSAVGFPAAPAAPVPPTPAPAPAPGITMLQHGYLPATLDRTKPGSVAVPQIMDAMQRVLRVAGSDAGLIRTGHFLNRALGIWRPHQEIVRLKAADDIPTATHEIGHGLQQLLYGTFKASGLKFLGSDIRRELIGLGRALYGGRKPVAGYTGEGFAEFMRYWLTTEDAGRVAPKMTAFFEGNFLTAHPEVASALKDARALVDIYRHQGSVERATRQLVREPSPLRRIADALAKFVGYQAQFESGAPIQAVSQAATKKLKRPLPPSEDPFKLFTWKRGSAGATVENWAMNHMTDLWGNPTGPSLAEALAPVKGRRQEFLLYVFAQAAKERWAQGRNPGIPLEDAQFIHKQFDSPEFSLAAQKYRNWMNSGLDYLVQADPAMKPAVDAMRAQNSFYAPLARMIDPAAAKAAAARGGSNPFQRMRGSGLPVKDIFDQTFINMARLVHRANRALVTRSIVRLAQIPGLGHIVERIPRDRVAERVNIEQIRQQLEDMGVDTSGVPVDEILQYFAAADTPKGSAPIISVNDAAGQPHWYQVDARLYDQLETLQTYSLKNAFPGVPGLGPVLDLVLGAPSRAFRLGTTGLRPSFSLVTNPARDVATLIAQTSSNPAKAAAMYPGALREAISGGPYKQAFFDLGAHLGQPLGTDIAHTQRVSKQLFHGRVLRVVRNPVDHLRELLSIPESAPRIAELKAVADDIGWQPGRPMTPDQAVQLALAAKRVTVDFSAAGDVGRILNQALPFYNPALQGMRAFARTVRNHPLRSALVGATLFTAPTLALWWANKDKEWWKALPWRERYLYTHIDDGVNVWQIPRPFEWGNTFMVAPEALLDSWYRHDPEAAKAALGHIFDTSNPLDYPQTLKLAKEQWQNRIEFWDRPIVPRGEVDLPASEQVGPYTSRLAVAINRAFPDLSPRRVDAAVRGYFGGAGSDLVQLLGLGATRQERDWEAADLPVFGTLFRRGGEFNAQNQHINDFWDTYLPSRSRVVAFQYARQQAARGARSANQLTPPSSADLAATQIGEDAGRAIRELQLLAARTRESRARAELYREAGEIARRATESMKTLQQPAKP